MEKNIISIKESKWSKQNKKTIHNRNFLCDPSEFVRVLLDQIIIERKKNKMQ